jgi:hypothetical protein
MEHKKGGEASLRPARALKKLGGQFCALVRKTI